MTAQPALHDSATPQAMTTPRDSDPVQHTRIGDSRFSEVASAVP